MAEQTTDSPEQMLEIMSRYTAARDFSSDWRKEARRDFDFYAGNQWDQTDRQKLEEQSRVPITFNRVGVLVDAVIGYETNNRQETRYIPRTQGDAKVNEIITESGKYFRDQCDAEFEESDAFRDMCISGMGWTEDYLTDERNPEYDLVRSRVDPLEMLWDPSAKKPNLADARYIFRKKWYPKEEAKLLFPKWGGELVQADWMADEFDADGSVHETTRAHVTSTARLRIAPWLKFPYLNISIRISRLSTTL